MSVTTVHTALKCSWCLPVIRPHNAPNASVRMCRNWCLPPPWGSEKSTPGWGVCLILPSARLFRDNRVDKIRMVSETQVKKQMSIRCEWKWAASKTCDMSNIWVEWVSHNSFCHQTPNAMDFKDNCPVLASLQKMISISAFHFDQLGF